MHITSRLIRSCAIAAIIGVSPVAVGAAYANTPTMEEKKAAAAQAKLDKAASDLEKNIDKLQAVVDDDLPNVPFTSTVARRVTAAVKAADRAISTAEKTDPSFDMSDLKERYEPLKLYFENKAEETPSPAAKELRAFHFDLKLLEQRTAKGERRRFPPLPIYSFITLPGETELKLSNTLAAAMELDPDYDYSQLLERYEPYARGYVQQTGHLLAHMNGFERQQDIAKNLTMAQNIIRSGRVKEIIHMTDALASGNQSRIQMLEERKAALLSAVDVAEKGLPTLKDETKDIAYYDPFVLENTLAEIQQGIALADKNELIGYEKIDTPCQKAVMGKVVFGDDNVTMYCKRADFISSFAVGEGLYMRAGFEFPADAYIKMRDFKLTPGVPHKIGVQARYELDGEELFTFYPNISYSSQVIEAEVVTRSAPARYAEFYWNIRDVFKEMIDRNKKKGVLNVKLYAYNGEENLDPSLKLGPLLAEGSVTLDASSAASQKYLMERLVGFPPPGGLHKAYVARAKRALDRYDVEYDVVNIVSEEETIVKNILDIPIKIVVSAVVAKKNGDGTCSVYTQWFQRQFTGTGYVKELSFDKKEGDKSIHCKALDKYK